MPMLSPDAGNAPSMVGQAPPDRVQMTIEDHFNAILDYLRDGLENGTLAGEDMMAIRAFEEAKQQILESALGQQQPAATPSPADMNGPEVPYGQESGDTAAPPRAGGF